MPRQSPSSSRVVVLGGGRGLTAVLSALRNERVAITVIVGIGSLDEDDERHHRLAGAADVEDLRRSLETMSAGEAALVRAMGRAITVERLGDHAAGNLMLASIASGLGDYGRASAWFGEHLGVAGQVWPATTEPVRLEISPLEEPPEGRPSGPGPPGGAGPPDRPGGAGPAVRRLRFVGPRPESPAAAVEAIEQARVALLAPGALYHRPERRRRTGGRRRVAEDVRLCRVDRRLQPDAQEVADGNLLEDLSVLAEHGVRVDVVLLDSSAERDVDPAALLEQGVECRERPLRSDSDPAAHDPKRLRAALREIIWGYGQKPALA